MSSQSCDRLRALAIGALASSPSMRIRTSLSLANSEVSRENRLEKAIPILTALYKPKKADVWKYGYIGRTQRGQSWDAIDTPNLHCPRTVPPRYSTYPEALQIS